jgi:peptide chain release factor 2
LTGLKKPRTVFDLAGKEKKIVVIEKQMQEPDFWQEHQKAAQLNRELAELKEEREKWEKIDKELMEMPEMIELLETEPDLEKETEKKFIELGKIISKEELKIFFSGPYDKNNVLLSVYSGAGGTEAQDWAQMLLRMYSRYGEKKGFKVKTLNVHEGQEAGIKNATIEIKGSFAYGTLKGESGVHRLVRLSPFNSNNLRHTSFALVEIMPEIEEAGDIIIKPEDLRVDTYRSSGPGGQNVNKVETAVRLTHLPSGIVVACQSERSQSSNREQAMKMLLSRIYQLELKKKQKEVDALRSGIQSGEGTAEWGSQIRNYVLHPYKLVKDLRTGVESTEPDKVLDGELEEFIKAEIINLHE